MRKSISYTRLYTWVRIFYKVILLSSCHTSCLLQRDITFMHFSCLYMYNASAFEPLEYSLLYSSVGDAYSRGDWDNNIGNTMFLLQEARLTHPLCERLQICLKRQFHMALQFIAPSFNPYIFHIYKPVQYSFSHVDIYLKLWWLHSRHYKYMHFLNF